MISCFDEYLYKIAGREATPACYECCESIDGICHTLDDYAAWGSQRCPLVAIIDENLSLSSVVRSMVISERCWPTVVSFCKEIMSQKEATERSASQVTTREKEAPFDLSE